MDLLPYCLVHRIRTITTLQRSLLMNALAARVVHARDGNLRTTPGPTGQTGVKPPTSTLFPRDCVWPCAGATVETGVYLPSWSDLPHLHGLRSRGSRNTAHSTNPDRIIPSQAPAKREDTLLYSTLWLMKRVRTDDSETRFQSQSSSERVGSVRDKRATRSSLGFHITITSTRQRGQDRHNLTYPEFVIQFKASLIEMGARCGVTVARP